MKNIKNGWLIVAFLVLTASGFGGYKIVRNQTDKGYSGINIVDSETGLSVKVASLGELKTVIPTRLIGTAYSNGTKDPNFWIETVTGSGSVTQSGEITLSTGTTANSTAKYKSDRKARKVTGRANQFRAVARNVQSPSADCIRRIGAYDEANGFFMEFDGTVFKVVTRKDSVDTAVLNGNFNGTLGTTIDVPDTEFTKIIIEYTSLEAKYFVNGSLIHTTKATTTSLTDTQDLPVCIEIINENGNTTDNSFQVLFTTVLGLGQLETASQYKYIDGAGTSVCKYGAGSLRRIVVSDTSGDIIVYDNTSATGDTITIIDPSKTSGTLEYNAPFNDGLTVVTTSGTKCTIIYE